MDSETKAAFSKVDNRFEQVETLLVRLAEGQVKHDVAIAKLTEQGIRTATLLDRLAEEVSQLARGQDELRKVIQDLGGRMDGYTEAVMRGLSEGVGRDRAIEQRMDALEDRVAKLEQRT